MNRRCSLRRALAIEIGLACAAWIVVVGIGWTALQLVKAVWV